MGQGQSSSADGGTPQSGDQLKTDYYELLGVERHAADDEIKKAYRRKALELHPDRNYGNVENATKLFAEIQSAYEVLSDPQERAWYDSHRDILLRGDTGGGVSVEEFSYNIRMTTADDVLKLMMKFNGSLNFTNAPSGFYGGLQEFFNKLAREEEIACQWEGADAVDYPSFGLKEDDYEDMVRPFYAAWNGFATKKSYMWKDYYRLSEAPDRRIRRLMEKENRRLREEGIHEFNDAVRSLLAFVRKRDPRFQENQKSETERQKILRDAANAQAARSRAARQARMQELDQATVPEWSKSRTVDEHEGGFSSDAESEEHEFECVVCNKSFKSEAQYLVHERSKKHIKLFRQLRREMRDEGQDLELENSHDEPDRVTDQQGNDVFPGSGDHDYSQYKDGANRLTNSPLRVDPTRDSDGCANVNSGPDPSSNADTKSGNISSFVSASDEDEEYAPRFQVEERLEKERPEGLTSRFKATVLDDTPSTSDTEASKRPKLGKAKQKRAKKAAQKTTDGIENENAEFKCVVCHTEFPSKTRLFTHIKDQGHAAPIAQVKVKNVNARQSGSGNKK